MSLPTFEEFYEKLHDHPPFPWQSRLVKHVLAEGWQNLLLDLPTGAGKTTALEIAVYCLACAPERMPRRTLLVVDRRVVVDQAAIGARQLQARLDGDKDGPVFEIAQRLRALTGDTDHPTCLSVALMRGGMPRENDWARTPDLPVVGLSTVDQVGSRLLFRGYGLNPRSAPIHAGLLGNDTLILLDEVHLARPFQQTLEWIERRFQTHCPQLPRRFAVVPMSATAGADSRRTRFGLSRDDWEDRLLVQRLESRKLARLEVVAVAGEEKARLHKLAGAAAKEALALQTTATPVVGVVVNRVETARALAQILAKDGHNSLLITGRMRALDRDDLTKTGLLPGVGSGRDRSTAKPLIVVATQCIEAGADLDFDALVTECAALDALKQRFGRLDRRGELQSSQAVVLIRSDQVGPGKKDDVYEEALSKTWEWLSSIAPDKVVDFGIKALLDMESNNETTADLLSPHLDAPILMPAHLDGWAQTAPVPSPDSNPALWLHGPTRTQADVQILWRHLHPALEVGSGAVFDLLDAIRPSSLETISIPIAAAKNWLSGLPVSPISDVLYSRPEENPGTGSKNAVAFRWTGDANTSGWVTPSEIRPGQVLVVDCGRGGLSNCSFNPESVEQVSDLGDLAQWRARGVASLRLNQETMAFSGLEPAPRRTPNSTDREYQNEVREWLAGFPEGSPEIYEGWADARKTLAKIGRLRVIASGEALITAKIPRSQPKPAFLLNEAETENEASLFDSTEGSALTLEQHCKDVEKTASRFARNLTFGAELSADLALASRLHDLGKADRRFQCWLAGGDEIRLAMNDQPLAKSAVPNASASQREAARKRAGYPKGYRHELLSLAMAEGGDLHLAHDRELVLHLIASHHGWCRPFAPLQDDPEDRQVDWDGWSGSTRHRKARLESGVGERFWNLVQRYGWWGLAWLESLVRLADHNASEQRQQ